MIQDSDSEVLEKTEDVLYTPIERAGSNGWPDMSGIKDMPRLSYREWLDGFTIGALESIVGREIELVLESNGNLGEYINAIQFYDGMLNLTIHGHNRNSAYGYTTPSSVEFSIILSNVSLRDKGNTRGLLARSQRVLFTGSKEDEYEYPLSIGKQEILKAIFNYIKKYKDKVIYQPVF